MHMNSNNINRHTSEKGGCFLKKRIFLIPLALVILGLLVPMLYAAVQNDQKQENPRNASLQVSDKENKGEGSLESNRQEPEKGSGSTTTTPKNDGSKESAAGQNSGGKANSSSQTKERSNAGGSSSGNAGKPSLSREYGPAPGYERVSVTIVEKSIIYGPQDVDIKQGCSVLDALYATGVPITVKGGSYVAEIDGIAENLKTGGGWMYAVNGGDPPSVAAYKYELTGGERVIWFYGKLGDKPPQL